MALDARDIPDTKVDVSFASRKPKTKPAADLKRAYGTGQEQAATRPTDEAPAFDISSQQSEVVSRKVQNGKTKAPTKMAEPKSQLEASIAAKSKEEKQTDRAAMLHEILGRLGPERAMRYLILRELANESGRVQISQPELASFLRIKSPTALRAFCSELCQKGLLSIIQDFDAGNRVARAYQLLPITTSVRSTIE